MNAVLRWLLRVVVAIVLLTGIYVAVLLYPSPLFAHKAQFGGYRLYSDEPVPASFGDVIKEAEFRLAAMEHEPVSSSIRIYLCRKPEMYAFFARLLRKSPRSLAIGLSVGRSMFVSMSRVEEFARRNGGRLRHTRFEGNFAEVVAHEIAHFNSVRALGFRQHLAQPMWKSEGWAEYQANVAFIRSDPDYDLADRIRKLLDDRSWRAGASAARRLWESQVVTEYLGEVEGLGLAEITAPGLTLEEARGRMLDWYGAPAGDRSSPSASRSR